MTWDGQSWPPPSDTTTSEVFNHLRGLVIELQKQLSATTSMLGKHHHRALQSDPVDPHTREPLIHRWTPPGVTQPDPLWCGECYGSFTGPHICPTVKLRELEARVAGLESAKASLVAQVSEHDLRVQTLRPLGGTQHQKVSRPFPGGGYFLGEEDV